MKEKEFYEIKTYVKDVLNYILIIESIGFDVNIYKQKVNDIYKSMKINQEDIWLKNEEVHDIYINLRNNYGRLLDIKSFFERINLSNMEDIVNNLINDVISNLEKLKESDFFLEDSMCDFIYNIYKTSYEIMKFEFLLNNESVLFTYFVSNFHDYHYINSFIVDEVMRLKESVNYVNGLTELLDMFYKKDDNYLSLDLILKLSIINYPIKSDDIVKHELYRMWEIMENMVFLPHCYDIILSKKKYDDLFNEFNNLKINYKNYLLKRMVDLESNEMIINRIERTLKEIEWQLKSKRR